MTPQHAYDAAIALLLATNTTMLVFRALRTRLG